VVDNNNNNNNNERVDESDDDDDDDEPHAPPIDVTQLAVPSGADVVFCVVNDGTIHKRERERERERERDEFINKTHKQQYRHRCANVVDRRSAAHGAGTRQRDASRLASGRTEFAVDACQIRFVCLFVCLFDVVIVVVVVVVVLCVLFCCCVAAAIAAKAARAPISHLLLLDFPRSELQAERCVVVVVVIVITAVCIFPPHTTHGVCLDSRRIAVCRRAF
jgi:hypothetical protein